MGRVAETDVVEDGLTEDVPSSMVGCKKLRGALVRGQEPRPFWEGDRAVDELRVASALCPVSALFFLREKAAENMRENGE